MPGPSSRSTRSGAGWTCVPGRYLALMEASGAATRSNFSWLDPRPLWATRNDYLVERLGDPINDLRRAWLRTLAPPSLTAAGPSGDEASFVVLGDPGEGDDSQWAVVPALEAHRDVDFLWINSDIIYPAGGVRDYGPRFFAPYARFEQPIYAVPGNHDWYDEGVGFMRWFCGARERPEEWGSPRLRRLRDLGLWRRGTFEPAPEVGAAHDRPGRRPSQPGPYFALDAGPVRLIGIDTGITGVLDRDQFAWLREVSRDERPKILMTGKPLYRDGHRRRGRVEGGGGSVSAVVRDPKHHYLAVIGGDVHNYQRYLTGGIAYIVNGGGGAFMHETHTIENLDRVPGLGVREADFHCYPLRGDSLARYSELYAKRLRMPSLALDPDVAGAIIAERLGVRPARPAARAIRPSPRERRTADVLYWLPTRGRRMLHFPFSEWLDFDEPPFFKSFLRVDATANQVRIRCFGVSGCAGAEDDPPVEDELVASRTGDDWTWRVVRPA